MDLVVTIVGTGNAEDLSAFAAFLQDRLNDSEMETGVVPKVEWERRVKQSEDAARRKRWTELSYL